MTVNKSFEQWICSGIILGISSTNIAEDRNQMNLKEIKSIYLGTWELLQNVSFENRIQMQEQHKNNTTNHLANERTFLAWVRTAIAMMGFGFILVKFSLFLKQLSLVAGDQVIVSSQKGYSGLTGILLVAVGVLTLMMSYLNYLRTKKEINTDVYKGNSNMLLILTVLFIALSIFLIYYLVTGI